MLGRLLSRVNHYRLTWKNARDEAPGRPGADALLRELGLRTDESFSGAVLVDATWDNPNYWLRYSILRKALGLGKGREIGLLGEFRRYQQSRTLTRLGITERADFRTASVDRKEIKRRARALWKNIERPEQILELRLPQDIPPDFLYDVILKRQRLSSVNCADPKAIGYVTDFLESIEKADWLIDRFRPDLVVSSHALGSFIPLVWCSLKRGIPVLIPFGDNGFLKYWKIRRCEEIYDFMDRPSTEDLANLDRERAERLRSIGENCLKSRFAGRTSSLAVRYTYGAEKNGISREGLCLKFGWDPSKPIVGVYAANWFDYPHFLGMAHFRDFEDWIVSTHAEAAKNLDVNWLFRGHPVDDWYGGMTLGHVMDHRQASHIRLSEKGWNGQDLMECIDAVITFHGTIGIEATVMRKPVLVADRGWYDDWAFVRRPASRQEYLELLRGKWWTEMDLDENSRKANIFAGWYWSRPAWQKNWVLDDDSDQWKLHDRLAGLLAKSSVEIELDTKELRDWFHSGQPHFHTYKISKANELIAD